MHPFLDRLVSKYAGRIESNWMERRRYTMLGRWLLVWGMVTVALTTIVTGLIKLGAPWSDATVEVALQDDTLLEEAKALFPSLDFETDKFDIKADWLRSKNVLQSSLQQLQPGHRFALTELGDTWDIRLRERLKGWGCAEDFSRWSFGIPSLCSWLDVNDEADMVHDQRDIMNERLSFVLSDDVQRLSISFRSAHDDLSIAIVTSLGERLVAEREAAKQALHDKITNWIETERTKSARQLVALVEDADDNEDDLLVVQAEIRLFRKVAAAMEGATDNLGRLEAIKRNQAVLTDLVTQDIVPKPPINEALERQVADVERDRLVLSDELAKMTAAFKNREWQGYHDLLPVARKEEQETRSATELSNVPTKDQYTFLVHPDWTKPATVMRDPVSVTGISTLTAVAIALPLAITIAVIVALLRMVLSRRHERRADDVEASFYANPHWPSVRSSQQSELNSAA